MSATFDSTSEGLLTEILVLVRDLNHTVTGYNSRIDNLEGAVIALNERLDAALVAAFVNGDLPSHRKWHEDRNLPAWRRTIINLLS